MWMRRVNCRTVHPEERPFVWREVVNQNVSVRQQIQCHTALICVEVQEEAAVFGIDSIVKERTTEAGSIAIRGLDFDHIGTQQRHQLGRESGGDAVATLHHPDVVQGQASRRYRAMAASKLSHFPSTPTFRNERL